MRRARESGIAKMVERGEKIEVDVNIYAHAVSNRACGCVSETSLLWPELLCTRSKPREKNLQTKKSHD